MFDNHAADLPTSQSLAVNCMYDGERCGERCGEGRFVRCDDRKIPLSPKTGRTAVKALDVSHRIQIDNYRHFKFGVHRQPAEHALSAMLSVANTITDRNQPAPQPTRDATAAQKRRAS